MTFYLVSSINNLYIYYKPIDLSSYKFLIYNKSQNMVLTYIYQFKLLNIYMKEFLKLNYLETVIYDLKLIVMLLRMSI